MRHRRLIILLILFTLRNGALGYWMLQYKDSWQMPFMLLLMAFVFPVEVCIAVAKGAEED